MKNERNTLQKKVILDELKYMMEHPTADQIYQQIHKKYPTISRATVFRNLKMLAEQEKVLHIPMPNGADCYESITKPHYHVKCSGCGRVSDVTFPYMDKLDSEVKSIDSEFVITGHSLVFEGLCHKCR
ncbi:MAG: transcriptional repressor [Lachnospiraceae bacterium]|nr:transcriptional repressor [Lachnospiraceae bacterium]